MEKLASDASGEEKASGSSSKRSRTEKDREEKEAYQTLKQQLLAPSLYTENKRGETARTVLF